MANLKGRTYEKQSKNAFLRLEAFKVGRVGKNDNLTHSDKLAQKREMYLRDIIKHFEANDIDGKLNQLFTKDNLNNFFNNRFENLSTKTQENYLRGFSSMLKGLEAKNITIPLHSQDKNYFNDKVSHIKANTIIIVKNRYINNINSLIDNLYKDREISGLLAQIQYFLILRQSEVFELIRNPLKYIDNGYVNNLVGKGNHTYNSKSISFELEQKILNNQNSLIDKSTYYRDLQKYN
ncbi:MAG: hypothetical protein U9N59_08425, partial [Campylobacterota bacterium]|nr:hypothetical protein [Campylobacterota bacterium]